MRTAQAAISSRKILPVPPLLKEGTYLPPLGKGAAQSAGEFACYIDSQEKPRLQYRSNSAQQHKEYLVWLRRQRQEKNARSDFR
jgi:hypothetical protein